MVTALLEKRSPRDESHVNPQRAADRQADRIGQTQVGLQRSAGSRSARAQAQGTTVAARKSWAGDATRPAVSRSQSGLPRSQVQAPPQQANDAAEGFSLSLPQLFVSCGYFVAVVVMFVCGADLVLAEPFSRASAVFDTGFLVCGAVLLYLSWNAYRDCCR